MSRLQRDARREFSNAPGCRQLRRMIASRSERANGFSKWAKTSSGGARFRSAVIDTTVREHRLVSARMALRTPSPSRRGMLRSRTTRHGAVEQRRRCSSASIPSYAATTLHPRPAISSRSASRIPASSSATKILPWHAMPHTLNFLTRRVTRLLAALRGHYLGTDSLFERSSGTPRPSSAPARVRALLQHVVPFGKSGGCAPVLLRRRPQRAVSRPPWDSRAAVSGSCAR